MFEEISAEVRERARKVRLLVLDVDGVLTDGTLAYDPEGESLKHFNVRDGLGIRLLQQQGYRVALISARAGAPLRRRAADLGIAHVVEGVHDKLPALTQLAQALGVTLDECAYMGDDLWDLPALRSVAFAVSVPDAQPQVRRQAQYVTRTAGGRGAVREVADLLLYATGRLESATTELLDKPRAASFGVVIPARWASTRLPGKPLREIAGKPMVLHVCQNALDSGAEFVVVATDDERIERVVSKAGIDVTMTSPEHRSGTDRLAEVIDKRGLSPSTIVVNVQGDEPLLAPAWIKAAGEALATQPLAGMATLASRIDDPADWTNPNVVKVVLNRAGFAQYFSRAPIPFVRDTQPSSDQVLPSPLEALRHIGIYAYRTEALKRITAHPPVMAETCESLEQLRALWLGISIHVSVVEGAAPHGVDTEEDLMRVGQVMAASLTRDNRIIE